MEISIYGSTRTPGTNSRSYSTRSSFFKSTTFENTLTLELKFRDHLLKGDYVDCRECHIQPDFLLIYRLTETQL